MSEKFKRCWCCGNLFRSTRIEKHHILGKEFPYIKELCVLCHDIVDRTNLKDLVLETEYPFAALNEIERYPELKNTRIFILKLYKILVGLKKSENYP